MPRIRGSVDADGATAIVTVRISGDAELFLRQHGRLVPGPMHVTALLDIGASCSAVHPEVLRRLNSQESGFLPLAVIGEDGRRENKELPVHDLRILLGDFEPAFHVQAVAAVPVTPTVYVLVGRDILDRCKLFYNGPKGEFRLSF